MVSVFPLLSNTSHNLTEQSQEDEARMGLEGEKETPLIGPSCPVSIWQWRGKRREGEGKGERRGERERRGGGRD